MCAQIVKQVRHSKQTSTTQQRKWQNAGFLSTWMMQGWILNTVEAVSELWNQVAPREGRKTSPDISCHSDCVQTPEHLTGDVATTTASVKSLMVVNHYNSMPSFSSTASDNKSTCAHTYSAK